MSGTLSERAAEKRWRNGVRRNGVRNLFSSGRRDPGERVSGTLSERAAHLDPVCPFRCGSSPRAHANQQPDTKKALTGDEWGVTSR